jgi:hypothetical protein
MSAATPPDIETTTDEELLFCLLIVSILGVSIRVCADLPNSNIQFWSGPALRVRLRLCVSGINELISLLDYRRESAASEFFPMNILR